MPRSSLLDAPGAGGGGVERSASAETSLVNVSLSSAASGANTSMPGPDASAAEGGDSRSDLDPDTSGLTNMLCAWAIGLLSAVEGTISVPSLWQYVESIGGDHSDYALCISGFALFRVLAMGVFGMWVDSRPYKEVWAISLLISMLGGWIYAAGPTLGVWAVVIGRAILGAMSAQSVACEHPPALCCWLPNC